MTPGKFTQQAILLVLILLSTRTTFSREAYTLNTFLAEALSNHPQLKIRAQQIRDRQYERKIRSYSFWPVVTASLNSNRYEQGPREVLLGAKSFIQAGSVYNYFSSTFQVQKSLLVFGRRQAVHQAELNESQSRQLYLEGKRHIIGVLLRKYIQYSEADAHLRLLMREAVSLKQVEKYTIDQFSAGLVDRVDLHRMESRVLSLELQMESERAAKARAEHILQSYLTLNDSSARKFQPVGIKDSVLFTTRTQHRTPNPRITSAALEVQIARSMIRDKQLDRLPQFTLYGFYQRSNRQLAQVYGNVDKNWNTGISLGITIPILNSSEVRIQRQEHESRLHAAEQTLRLAEIEVRRHQRRQQDQMHYIRERLRIAESMVRTHQVLYEFHQTRYRGGTGRFEEMSTAYEELLRLRRRVVGLEYDFLRTGYALAVMRGVFDGMGE